MKTLLVQISILLGSALLTFAAEPMTTTPPAPNDRSPATTEATPEGCALERFTVRSACMNREIKAVVVLPPGYEAQSERRYPILYALHGRDAPYDTFSAMVPLRKALKEKPMIVVCFDGDAASLYLDSPYPQKGSRDKADTTLVPSLFTTFFFDELIPCIDRHYRVNAAQRMLTGFSMGGFGAFHYLLARPGQFVSVSSLSGWFPVWPSSNEKERAWMERVAGPYQGNEGRYADFDSHVQIKKRLAAGVKLPPLLLCCGTEDRLLEGNRAMHAFLDEQRIGCDYRESPGGHAWPYWQGMSADVVDFHWRTLPKP